MGERKLRCQRIACDAMFTEDDNPGGCCRYHEGPIFHDGMKEWSCCKQRSHDFSMFLQIPGCKTGKHTTEKPVTKAAPSPNKPIPQPSAVKTVSDAVKGSCARCRQRFFCSDHGTHVRQIVSNHSVKPLANPVNSIANTTVPPRAKVVDINEPQVCRNKGCGMTFREKDNHEVACAYHPGPAIFHDRMKGWKCCDVHVKEFDEFLEIPPCTKGWHNANAAS
ncbi:unnamed protein product [Victoria cruziana]